MINERGQRKPVISFLTLAMLAIAILAAGALSGCSEDGEGDHGKIGVVVTLLPQIEMVERIGGDRIDLTVLVPKGASPHSHELGTRELKAVSDADIYLTVGSGVEFEINYLSKIAEQNPDMELVDCSSGIDLLEVGEDHDQHDGEDEGDGEDGEESHDDHEVTEGMDPHIWMSPSNMRIMANNVFDALVEVDPEGKAEYRDFLREYLEDLDDLISYMHGQLDSHSNSTFLVYHPAFNYLAREFNLTQLAVEEDGKEPGTDGLATVIGLAKRLDIKVVFAEPQFDQSNARVIADEIGGEVVLVDPLPEDYLDEMMNTADRMKEGFEK